MGKKSTNAEYEKRVNDVYTLILSCASRQKIWQYASNQWGVSKREMDRYIAEATKRLEEKIDQDATALRDKHIRMKQDLYNRAYADKNWALCKEIENDMAKFFDLYPEKESALNLNINRPIRFVSMGSVPQRGSSDPSGKPSKTKPA